MTDYASRDLNTSTNPVPGTSRMYRLPTMTPGVFHLTATGHSLPGNARVLADTKAADATRGSAGIGGINTTGTLEIGNNPGNPGNPGGPVIPPPYTVSLDLFHGDQLVASGAPPPLQQVVSAFDDAWRVRVNYTAQSQPADTIQFDLMPYPSTLPLLTRRIPLWFLQQGFDNNWNGRQYISLVFEDSTLSIRFDPEIASYYHLSEQDIPVATHITEVPPNMMVKDIRLRVDSSDSGFEELTGHLPYIQVTVTVGGIGGQPITGSIAEVDFKIDDFSITIKFFITQSPGIIDNTLSTVVGYRAQVTTDLLEKISTTNVIGDIVQFFAGGKANSYFYKTVIPNLQSKIDGYAGVVGAALTPWLLGADFTVWDVRYDPTNSQTLPQASDPHPWVPQGDLVITYMGLAEPSGQSPPGLQQLPATLTITTTAEEGVTGTHYSLPLSAVSGTPPYTWSVSGTLPPGVTASGATISGTPTTQGVFPFQAKVTDAHGTSVTQTLAVAINGPGFSIATPPALPRTVVGDAYAVAFTASGGSGHLKWSATGLPSGLAMAPTGVLSGTPTGDGSSATIVVQAVDAHNAVARRVCALTVLDPLLFQNEPYTPRGAGTVFYSPPPAPAHAGTGPVPVTPPVSPGNLSKVDHIVVLMMENRSFDHMLGYLSKEGGRTDIEGLKWENDGNRTQFNYFNGRFYYPNRLLQTHLFNPESTGPDHSFLSVKAQMLDNMGHFDSDYALNKIQSNDPAQLSQVMGYYTGEQLPTYDMLAREFAVCDHWFCAHPGPTWPNRFVTLTGDLNRDSHGEPEVNTPLYSDFTPSEATTIFDLLTARKVSWRYFEQRVSTMRAYTKYTFDLANVLEYSDQAQGFAATVKAGLPNVTFVDPLFGDLPAGINSPQDNDDAPPSDLADGQRFVAEVVTTLFTPALNPNWQKTMLLIVYDEHGGFYDHVQPPSDAVPLFGQSSGKLGPRVPAFVVSPWTPAGLVLKQVFDHTSIAATILNRFCGPHPPFLSPRVSVARDLRDALPLAAPRGELTPLLGLPTRALPAKLNRAVARNFVAPSSDDDYGALLGALALGLGRGGGQG